LNQRIRQLEEELAAERRKYEQARGKVAIFLNAFQYLEKIVEND
jgi:hypothetical protein